MRATYGVRVVYAGLGVVLIAFVIAVIAYSAAGDVSTALAPITGVVGSLVGAYFGVQVGGQGKDVAEHRADQRVQRAEADRRVAEHRALRLAAAAPADVAGEILATPSPLENPPA